MEDFACISGEDSNYLSQFTFCDENFVGDGTDLADLFHDGGNVTLPQTSPATQPHDPIASSFATAIQTPSSDTLPPKLGGRFSTQVLRTLRNWLALHKHHPFPVGEQMDLLLVQTCLNKTQIMNWFANARRRGRLQKSSSASPPVSDTSSRPIDIIPRPGTPALKPAPPFQMQRYVDSPPEDEPASVGDIQRAMASRLATESPDLDLTREDPWLSWQDDSSGSSAGTSHSSTFSGLHSSGSQSSLAKHRSARKRRTRKHRRAEKRPIINPILAYQCTFCTETFKTKYDWQRHEKSLHLPLEQWVCGLHGPRAPRQDHAEPCCVFCGEIEPDDVHIEAHFYSACQQRTIEERTFHRKDHLNQHLRLVHNVRYADWAMNSWKMSLPDVRSQCGFCGIIMNTWTDRVDHLAEHFKMGKVMADWHGEWGFDEAVLNIVESAYPPYLIDFERNTVAPYGASTMPLCSPVSAYELLQIEIECYIQDSFHKTGQLPLNDELQLEACRTIFASESSSDSDLRNTSTSSCSSWLRDLIMSSPRLSNQAKFGPIRLCKDGRLPTLKINGKDTLFQQCTLEVELRAFVEAHQATGLAITDQTLQDAACETIRRLESESTTSSDLFPKWLLRLVYSNAAWLDDFKSRAGLPYLCEAVGNDLEELFTSRLNNNTTLLAPSQVEEHVCIGDWPFLQPGNSTNLTFTSFQMMSTCIAPIRSQGAFFPGDTNFYTWYVRDLARWTSATMSPNNPTCHIPSDEEIQHQARWIMYDGDDLCDQTMADNPDWLRRFKKDNGVPVDDDGSRELGNLGLDDGALIMVNK